MFRQLSIILLLVKIEASRLALNVFMYQELKLAS